MNSITVISSPYHVGIRDEAVGAGPGTLLANGMIPVLEKLGVELRNIEVKPSIDAEGDIGRSFELFRQTAKLVTDAQDTSSFPIVLAGNCSASVGVHAGLSGSRKRQNEDIGCVWFDAHDDFNVPDTVLSGYFDSMPIAIMAGQCWRALTKTIPGYRPLSLRRFVHCGLRDLNDLERERVTHAAYPVVWGGKEQHGHYTGRLQSALAEREKYPCLIHVDLDVLDPVVGQANKFEPAPGGLTQDDFLQCMKMLPNQTLPEALTIASYDPRYDRDGKISSCALKGIQAFVESLMKNKILTARND